VTLTLLALMAPTDSPNAGLTMLLFQVGAIGLVFYFLILRPQQQARKKHEELLKNLKKGDEVVTAGGIVGRVKDLKEDRVTVESGTSTLVVERSRIVKVGDMAAPGFAA
jgi:preprotein translocase subunit YajC